MRVREYAVPYSSAINPTLRYARVPPHAYHSMHYADVSGKSSSRPFFIAAPINPFGPSNGG